LLFLFFVPHGPLAFGAVHFPAQNITTLISCPALHMLERGAVASERAPAVCTSEARWVQELSWMSFLFITYLFIFLPCEPLLPCGRNRQTV
jgi:hypothetical protein